MSSIGTGYDFSATTFSPDGRVFQVEYANKAVENSGTTLGIKCVDGVVFGVEKFILTKLHEPDSNNRNFSIDSKTGLAFSGLAADARALVSKAREEAKNYRKFYGHDIPCDVLGQRLGHYMQYYTLYSFIRPFGCSVMIGSMCKDNGPQLQVVEPNGVNLGYYACAIGKRRQQARTELEKLKLESITVKEAVDAIAKIIYSVHDDVKDKEFQLEMSWVCKDSKNKHDFIPKETVKAAVDKALAEIENEDD